MTNRSVEIFNNISKLHICDISEKYNVHNKLYNTVINFELFID